ncbi:winged helix-turn-helix transcriptional regulator [Marinirhabdus gelatinilytica]|uniref:Winged helix-turn-helix DNA-binding protein n=1 Tax=Marinirhabdus gelatinilytica TaxID=1703343 RepID=A0A370QES9_9FLAO|nr:winged helix-turn-helix transcriptional regulator [Marinirhabdus gelatinilytica]RDK86877.1 winged helix-turn-helix DNA-binding protein [Marinirhabdus gelatinilytica]
MKEQIFILLAERGELSVSEISDIVNISRQMVHRHLNALMEDERVSKIGTPPRVFYRVQKKESIDVPKLDTEIAKFIEENFIQINEQGVLLEGVEAFVYWSKKRNLPVEKTAVEYVKTKKRYNAYKNEIGLIVGLKKLENTKGFGTIYLKNLYYSDFYAIERFGKTTLGQMLLYAKQGQDRGMIKDIIAAIEAPLKKLVESQNIEAVGFIPPSVKREVQIMNELRKKLNFKLPIINIEKVQTEITVPQKTLSKLNDRILNAQNNIVVTERNNFSKILLIDDAVGSGATINETAGKIAKRNVSQHIIGYAITGSYKGFEVISEA